MHSSVGLLPAVVHFIFDSWSFAVNMSVLLPEAGFVGNFDQQDHTPVWRVACHERTVHQGTLLTGTQEPE